tara:strand:- start:288 stop:602 length:315 start_codon:yes stop_codon:yes gene_type:complete
VFFTIPIGLKVGLKTGFSMTEWARYSIGRYRRFKVAFKVGDHISSEIMEVEGVIIEIHDPVTEMARRSGIMRLKLFVMRDATWPDAINTRTNLTIDPQHWRVTK